MLGLQAALRARAGILDEDHQGAWRLFNGFTEGDPSLVLDVYARTLVVHDYGGVGDVQRLADVVAIGRGVFPWLQSAVVKPREAVKVADRRGRSVWGLPDRRIQEEGVRYAVDLLLNRDPSFYLDTRALRRWLRGHAQGKRVLNAFAYTGSLGAAALAGGASAVVQVDRNRRFLNLAKETYTLNGFRIDRASFAVDDVFRVAGRLRRAIAADPRRAYDIVIVDPPPFAATRAGRVELLSDYGALLNKLRPLVADGGVLIAVNNALFLSGQAYEAVLAEACADGYLTPEARLPVPADVIGLSPTQVVWPADPSPYSHPTKIAVLRVRRK
jgi:23S rRNA (cytosine1962-C5)-methyltransferase